MIVLKSIKAGGVARPKIDWNFSKAFLRRCKPVQVQRVKAPKISALAEYVVVNALTHYMSMGTYTNVYMLF